MPRAKPRLASFPTLQPHAAGIDVHAARHWVAVPPGSAPPHRPPPRRGPLPPHVRAFGACTADLDALADWLRDCGVTDVAMEATGVYWVPLFELLERRGFAVILVDPRQTRQVTGRPKSDRLDCQWIQRLHGCGLLAASFRPSDDIVVLRGFLRQRQRLIQDAARQVQHMQKALEQMNVKLTEVVSDIAGVTGLAILHAIRRGERDPAALARLRHPRCRASEAEIARALCGTWRAEHLFALEQALAVYETYQRLLATCDQRIATCLQSFTDRSAGRPLPAKRRHSRKATALHVDARALCHRLAGVDLTGIEGIDEATALVVLSEVGTDMTKFPTAKHFASWLGLCPNHRGSGGAIKSRQVRRGCNRAAKALRLAAQGCCHAKNAMGGFYRRIRARCGGPKAVVATARKIAERVWRLLRFGADYVRLGEAEYQAQYRRKLEKNLAKRAAELGYRLVPTAAPA
jgi:transposase